MNDRDVRTAIADYLLVTVSKVSVDYKTLSINLGIPLSAVRNAVKADIGCRKGNLAWGTCVGTVTLR